MVHTEQDGTDITSIRPVSSLRSQFEHMVDQKALRPPLTTAPLRKLVSKNYDHQGNSPSHGHSSSVPSHQTSAGRSASQCRDSKILLGGTRRLEEPQDVGADDLKIHHTYSSLSQRPVSSGSSYSVSQPRTIIAESRQSPTSSSILAPCYPPSTKVAFSSVPKPKTQPLISVHPPSNLLGQNSGIAQTGIGIAKSKSRQKTILSRSQSKSQTSSKADDEEFRSSSAPPPSAVNIEGGLFKDQYDDESNFSAQNAAESDFESQDFCQVYQLQECLPSDCTRSELRKVDASGHPAATSGPSPSTVNEQQFRPELPPRRTEKQPQQLPLNASRLRPLYDRSYTDHGDRHQMSPTHIRPRVPSAPRVSGTEPNPSRVQASNPPKEYQTSNRPVTSIVRSPQNDLTTPENSEIPYIDSAQPSRPGLTPSSGEYPDTSSSNRRHPFVRQGVQMIQTNYDTKLFEISNRYLCTSGYLTRAWDLVTGEMIMSLSLGEKDIRVTALAFKPGLTAENEGLLLWLGTNYGDLHEVDISNQAIICTESAAHDRREIVKVFRCRNNMWTLDDDGRLNIWHGSEVDLPSLRSGPRVRRIPRGHSFSILVRDTLWLANGTTIRIFRPNSDDDVKFVVRDEPLTQPGAGEITSGATIPGKVGVVYFGHADGKVTSYSTRDFTCLGIFNVSHYKINCLSGAGSYLWAGYSNGMIYVYDTNTRPWKTKKDWRAHDRPVINILVDLRSVWNCAQLQVASISTDNTVRLWDGILEEDWLENDMHEHETEYCSFRKINATIVTWNAGASTPASFRQNERNSKIFMEMLHVETPSDLLVFGFQELVDLEDKKLTAKNIFKANKKKDSSDPEHMSRQYRAWRDYLIRSIEDNMPSNEPYQLLHTASMVGLFSCIFVKASQRSHIDNMNAAELKRGLGGLHGNKGALILRFTFEDSSLCFVNCHLAAGQSQTNHRNNDASAILEAIILPSERDPIIRSNIYVGGGDGSMVLDHEICILNGDLNYRIETMGRETVIRAIHTQQYNRLLERDQLLMSRRRNPGFRLRDFQESPITFAPTYKYDLGTDNYDTSEKHRTPAWCDRILYRGLGKVEQMEYRRHELQISDHRPVSGTFAMNVKRIFPSKRQEAWEACEARFEAFKKKLIQQIKLST